MYENPFMKVYGVRHIFEVECNLLQTKNFSLPDHQLAENLILIIYFYRRTKKG